MPKQKKTVKKKPALPKKKTSTKGVTKCPKKAKLKTLERASYGQLKRKTGDGTQDRDHIPSNAALRARAKMLVKRDLTKAEASRVTNIGQAIIIPKTLHKKGRTYGGKNTKAQSSSDAKDLAKAAKS